MPIASVMRVVEFEHRHCGIRIDGAERWSELLVVAQVDLHFRHGDTLLGEKDAHAARARGSGAIVEFHRQVLVIGWRPRPASEEFSRLKIIFRIERQRQHICPQ
jgi:hypothetical protein